MSVVFRSARPALRRRRRFALGEPGTKTLVVNAAHLTLTARAVNLFYDPIAVAHLTLAGRTIGLIPRLNVLPSHLTLTAKDVSGQFGVVVAPAHLTLAGRDISFLSLTPFNPTVSRAPRMTPKRDKTPAHYWRGTTRNT
jgi:hypothetical protein